MSENEKNNKLAIWLHMHQPDYYDSLNGVQYLPWVRKHATKDYYLIPCLVAKSQAKININFSGILLEQLEKYANEEVYDIYQNIENKLTTALNASEVAFIENNFLIPLPNENERFKYLRDKKVHGQNLSVDEIRDAQVLFKLMFFAPIDDEVIDLHKKGAHFSENDKDLLTRAEKRIIQSLFELYKQLAEKKQVELTVTPYYHPILPLLIDIESAKKSKNNAILPNISFSHREDALYNIKKSLELFYRIFGFMPKGMWPAEGSISNEAIDLIKDNEIDFIGSDEFILRKSYQLPQGTYNVRGLKVLFRDHLTSDKIGFVYNKQNPVDAVKEIIAKDDSVIILDGENPWDYYPNFGLDFLTEFFSKLNENNSALGSESKPLGTIDSIEPGSWINGYFDTWIGDDESNRAWTYLANARDFLSNNEASMEEIYKGESSDFFWWYSNFHKKEVNYDFDLLFRNHLIKAYLNAKESIPNYLLYPIKNRL